MKLTKTKDVDEYSSSHVNISQIQFSYYLRGLSFNFGVGLWHNFSCYVAFSMVSCSLIFFNTVQGDFQPGVVKALNAQYCIIKQ